MPAPTYINEEINRENRRAARSEVSLLARVRPVRSTIDVARRTPPLGVAIMDISTLGLSFLTDYNFNIDDLVEVDLTWREVTLSFHGVVRHINTRAGLNTIGIQYLITASTKHAIATLSQWLRAFADSSISPGE